MKVCLVVDDSRLARKEMIYLLHQLAVFQTIYEAENAEQATAVLAEHIVDVVFLDIHMPVVNGFEWLESLDAMPNVIFTTAYDEYAMKSFDYNAIDYLLKPIKKERLERAINKLKPEQDISSANTNKHFPYQHLFVKNGEKCWFVKIEDIRLIESVGNYARIYFNEHRALIQRSLSYLETKLNQEQFFRVNRQQIVNLQYIEKLDVWFNDKLKIQLKTGEELEVSRRKSNQLKQLFSF